MSEGATQRTRTGPGSLISRQLIRAALRALINGPMGQRAAGQGIMCRFDAAPALGRPRPRQHGPAPGSGSGKRHPGPAREPAPHRGGPEERGAGLRGSPRRTTGDGRPGASFRPRGGSLSTGILVRSRVGSLTAPQLGGRRGLTGAGRGRARCTVKFNSLNIPLLKAAA